MSGNEVMRLREENRKLLRLLAWSHRRCERLEMLAMDAMNDLVERIEWTGETESLELAEAAKDELSIAITTPAASHNLPRCRVSADG